MQQTSLPFHYEEENESTGMTALSGLPAYLDLAAVARLGESVRRHVGLREGTQGWTDTQMVMSLVMLNLSGGESADDLRLPERDEGLGRVLLAGESHRMRRADRKAQRNRWRRVLKTFGALDDMTAAEAQGYADNGWQRCVPMAAEPEPTPAPTPEPTAEPEQTVPSSPANFAVTVEDGDRDISATWDALDGADTYMLAWQ